MAAQGLGNGGKRCGRLLYSLWEMLHFNIELIRRLSAEMSKYERMSRLMQIANTIRIHRSPNRVFLAKKYGVTVRTIQRDIDSLCYAGVPIFWSGNRYEIMDGYYMPPTNLSLEEALELVSAVRNHAANHSGLQAEAIESALSKIMARLPNEMLDDVKASMNETSSVEEDSPWQLGND